MWDRNTSFQIQKEDVQILFPLKVAYVFAAGEGQLRCTDGKLATSQDQCPATDRCPPSENNTVSNCVSEASANSTLQSYRCTKIQLMMKQKHHPLVWIIDLLCTLPSVQTRRLLLRMIHQLVSERDSSAKNKTISQYGVADNSDYLLFDTRRS